MVAVVKPDEEGDVDLLFRAFFNGEEDGESIEMEGDERYRLLEIRLPLL